MDPTFIITVSLIFIPIFSILISRIVSYNPLRTYRMGRLAREIPGPKVSWIPFVGNALEFFRLPHYELIPLFVNWSDRFGPVFKVWVFNRLYISLSSPDSIQKILSSSEHLTKSLDYDVLGRWLGQGLLTSNGEKWFHRRKLLSNTFLQFKLMPEFCRVFNEQSTILLEILREEGNDHSFDISPYLRRCALDIICEAGMNTKLGCQRKSDLGYLVASNRITEIVYQKILEPWTSIPFLARLLPICKEENKCLELLHSFTNNIIKERRQQRDLGSTDEDSTQSLDTKLRIQTIDKKTSSRKAFLDFLLDEGEIGTQFSDTDLAEETNTFIFGGHDTIAANLCWTILLLGANPSCQKKVQSELDLIFEGKTGTEMDNLNIQDACKMKYLDCCIKESLRIYPSVPAYNRLLSKDVLLEDGKILPAGSTVSINVFLLHRNAEAFPNPEVFDPDRFLPENSSGRHPYVYLPFSAGPRNCIGQKFSALEEKIVLAKLFWNFDILTTVPLNSIKIVWDLVLRPKGGVPITLTERKHFHTQ